MRNHGMRFLIVKGIWSIMKGNDDERWWYTVI